MERVPFFSMERGTERVPEIRGTTKALMAFRINMISQSIDKVSCCILTRISAKEVMVFALVTTVHFSCLLRANENCCSYRVGPRQMFRL